MRSIVLISHGDLARGMKESLEMIVGKQQHVYTVSLMPGGDAATFTTAFLDVMDSLEGHVLIIADLLGGTPCNVAFKYYHDTPNIDIVAGMTLPLVIEAVVHEQATTTSLVSLGASCIVDVKNHHKKKNAKPNDKAAVAETHTPHTVEPANVVNVRIDERLIHGQVAGIWTTSLNTQRIIVICDEAAHDDLQRSSLRMAAPSSMRLSILTAADAATNINAGRYGKQRLFLLFKKPADVMAFLAAGGKLSTVNVGNMSYKDGAREVTKTVKVLPEEEQMFKQMATQGIILTAQTVPNDPAIDLIKKLSI